MNKAWKEIDLDGKGVQSVNKRFVHARKNRQEAYIWWLLFPLGAHRIYLGGNSGAMAFSALSAITVILLISAPSLAIWSGLTLCAFALFDLWWIPRRIDTYNKQLRVQFFLQRDEETAPPSSFRGKYTQDHDELIKEYKEIKDQEIPAEKRVGVEKNHSSKHVPSFAEQEALLKDMAKFKRPSDQ